MPSLSPDPWHSETSRAAVTLWKTQQMAQASLQSQWIYRQKEALFFNQPNYTVYALFL